MTGNVVRTYDDVQTRINEANARTLTATVAGAAIRADATFVTITSSVITKVILLPAAVTGKELALYCATNGFSLQSAVAADDLNTVTVGGGTVEAICVAGTTYKLRYNNGNWTMVGELQDGVVAPVVVPA